MYKEIDMLKRTPEYEFSIGLRLTHWIRAICIVVLVITGYYISYVFIAPSVSSEPNLFLQAKWRFVHLVAGFVLIAATIFKLYLFLFDKKSRKELVSIKDFLSPKVWIAQIKYYLFLGEHPHLRGVYNPLQFIAYVGFYLVLFTICITGMILYVHIYHDGLGGFFYEILRPVEAMLGGLSEVRIIHHICMNIMIIFVPVHVYMVIFNAIKGKEGAMDAIISGYKFARKDNA
ncbi:MAG: Ni/Fe-hydrogenase, b-type cytochrome subunit [Campylobacter sp.]|nr:Ni/Fe-hydrogenase, b-type cytochrome subunit [Campylobacter sp.]